MKSKMSYTPNLDNYKSYPDTMSCYLDGRYFNMVLSEYPGLIKEPLNIIIFQDKNKNLKYNTHMNQTNINNNFPGLLRVIINTPEGRHSNLLIIDYKGKKLYRFDPHGRKSPYFDQESKMIEEYFDQFIDFDMYIIEAPIRNDQNNTCLEDGDESGFCVAYNIKYAYDYLNGRVYDPSHIMKFSNLIEQKYGKLPEEGKDVEYGWFGNNNPNQGRNALIGGVGGAVIGGAVGGPGGLVAGGIGGSLLGSLV